MVKKMNKESIEQELEIYKRLIDGIEERLKYHFRKVDRKFYEDIYLLEEIEKLIKQAKGENNEV